MAKILRAALLATAAAFAVTASAAVAQQGHLPPSGTLTGAYLSARIADDVDDLAAASVYYGQALARDTRNPNLLQRAFMTTIQSRGVIEALPYADRLAEVDASATAARLAILADDFRRRDFVAAMELADGLTPTGVLQYVMPFAEAWIYTGLGDGEAALAALEPLETLPGFESLYLMHVALIADLLEMPAAGDYYDGALAAGGTTELLIEAAGSYFARQGMIERAAVLFDDYLADHPTAESIQQARERLDAGEPMGRPIGSEADGLGEALYQLGNALAEEGADELALIYTRLAAFLRPDALPVQLLLGRTLDGAGMPRAALATFDVIDRATPHGYVAGIEQAGLLAGLERYEEAEAILRDLAERRPNITQAELQLADLLRAQEEYARAVEAYDRAAAIDPTLAEDDWTFLYRRAIALERLDRFEEAEADFLAALVLNPDYPHLLNYLGYSWADRGINIERAEEMILRANELEPNNGYIVDSVGWVYYRTGRLDEAVDWLERAVALLPDDPEINDHLGDAYWMVGRRLEARFQWQRALSFAEPEDDDRILSIERKLAEGLTEPGILSGFTGDLAIEGEPRGSEDP
ncbi:MAG: tetratricopeptide repeat protein [Azospirillaceae bacterium]